MHTDQLPPPIEVPTRDALMLLTLEELQACFAAAKRRDPYARGCDESLALSKTLYLIDDVMYDKRAEIERLQRFETNVQRFVANRIRLGRIESRLTQGAMATAVEMTPTQLSRIESCARKVSVAELIRFAIALRRPITYFTYPSNEAVIGTGWEPVGQLV